MVQEPENDSQSLKIKVRESNFGEIDISFDLSMTNIACVMYFVIADKLSQ